MRKAAIRFPFIVLCLAGAAKTAAAAKPIKIAVVRVSTVFEKYAKRADLDRRMRSERQKKIDIIREREKAVRRLEDQIKLFDLGAAGRRKLEDQLERKRIELETYRKLVAKTSARQYMDYTRELYEDICTAVEQYAKRQGYDLVLKIGDQQINADSINMLQLKIELSTVLYHSDALDITDRIIKILNAQYGKDIEEK